MPDNAPQTFTIPQNIRQRLLLAHLTPAKVTSIIDALEKGINERRLDDAAVDFEFVMEGEVFGASDLLPTITFGLRKAVPPPPAPKLELPR
jgi:hypothetical protein